MADEIDYLKIIYESEHFIAINKPHGLLVHRTSIAKDATQFAVQLLRNQLGQHVYPIHRLDRKTSGVLIFAKSNEANRLGQKLFREKKVYKRYLAIVRGWIEEEGVIDYPLSNNGKLQEAKTEFRLIKQFECSFASDKFPTSRYSLVELVPLNGRFHQLRKHMAHIFHPIIGDRPHGCNKQNRLWKERFDMTTMLLHAAEVSVIFDKNVHTKIEAPLSHEIQYALSILNEQVLT